MTHLSALYMFLGRKEKILIFCELLYCQIITYMVKYDRNKKYGGKFNGKRT